VNNFQLEENKLLKAALIILMILNGKTKGNTAFSSRCCCRERFLFFIFICYLLELQTLFEVINQIFETASRLLATTLPQPHRMASLYSWAENCSY
jgi:hypothetical protein